MLSLSFNLCHDKGWGDKENEVHCSPPGSPGTPLVGLNQESMESNFDISQVTRFKTWQRQSQHTTPTMSRDGRDFPLRYDMRGGSLKISLSRCWFFIRCHFPIVFSSA